MSAIRVGLVGASGETGTSIVNGLLEAGSFDVIALTPPASITKPANQALQSLGATLRSLDLEGPHDNIVSALKDIEILISTIGPSPPEQLAQIPLATAAKAAGVRRFLPCAAITVIPAGGIHRTRDIKEQVFNHVKQLYLPYTIVDVGWWYQISFPPFPSGMIDYAVGIPSLHIAGDGTVPSALTDLRDIGHYFARIIVDERTLNKMVLVYNEMWTQNEVYELVEDSSGEKLERQYDSLELLQARVKDGEAKLAKDPSNREAFLQTIGSQYLISWGIRGDNTPEYAKYLGYVTSKELYPEYKYVKFEDFVRESIRQRGYMRDSESRSGGCWNV